MPDNLIAPPADEPITLQEVKDNLRLSGDDEDSVVSELITIARQYLEKKYDMSFLTQTRELDLDKFENQIKLPRWPLQSVVSVKYIDVDGVVQTLPDSEYKAYPKNNPGVLTEAYGKVWPCTRDELNAVTVRYVAGWETPAAVEGPIKQAIHLMVGHYYENRENTSPLNMHKLPFGVESLMFDYRKFTF